MPTRSERIEAAPRPRAHAPLMRRVGAGFAVAGPGIWVFDEDRREAEAWGSELVDAAVMVLRRLRENGDGP